MRSSSHRHSTPTRARCGRSAPTPGTACGCGSWMRRQAAQVVNRLGLARALLRLGHQDALGQGDQLRPLQLSQRLGLALRHRAVGCRNAPVRVRPGVGAGGHRADGGGDRAAACGGRQSSFAATGASRASRRRSTGTRARPSCGRPRPCIRSCPRSSASRRTPRAGGCASPPSRRRLWNRVEVAGLHFAGERIDFSVEGTRVKVGSLPAGIAIDLGT